MIFIDGIEYRIGHFKTESEAIDEYKKVFKEWYGFEPKIKARAYLKENNI